MAENIKVCSGKEATDKKKTGDDFLDFTVKSKKSDVTFIVEGENVYASAAVLSISSPVFSDLIENARRNEFDMPDLSLEHFVEFLRCIYPDILQEVNETTVYWVLPLAHKYQVKNLKAKCIQLVLQILKKKYEKNAEELFRHIRITEDLSLQEVEKLCVQMVSECTLEDMENANKKHQISQGNYMKIFKLALRRHELAKEDQLLQDRFGNFNSTSTKFLRNLTSFTSKLISDDCDIKKSKAEKVMLALRLTYKHDKSNYAVKLNAMKKLLSFGELESNDLETYNILPEEIKRDRENFDIVSKTWSIVEPKDYESDADSDSDSTFRTRWGNY